MKEYICHNCTECVAPTAGGECPHCHGSNIERLNSLVVSHATEMTGIQKEGRCG